KEVGAERIIYFNFGTPEHYRRLAERPDVTLSAMFVMECPIVDPDFFRDLHDAQGYFKRIYSWADSEALEPFVTAPVRVEQFCWPQNRNEVHEETWRRSDRKFLTMMNSNKLPRLYHQEL